MLKDSDNAYGASHGGPGDGECSHPFVERVLKTAKERGLKIDHFRDQFQKLCHDGVQPNILAAYLQLITTPILHQKRSWGEYIGLFDEKELKKLPDDVEQIAERIEQISHCRGSKLAAPEELLQYLANAPAEQVQGRAFLHRQLPQLLRCYARDLRCLSAQVQRLIGPKRYSFRTGLAVDLLAIVKEQTKGNQHYEAVANLLSTCFAVENINGPAGLQSADGLAQTYARYSKRGYIRRVLSSRQL